MSTVPESFASYKKLGPIIETEGFGVISREGRVAFLFGWPAVSKDDSNVTEEKHLTIVLPDDPEIIEAMMGEVVRLWPSLRPREHGSG